MFVKTGVDVRAALQVLDVALLTEDLADEVLMLGARLAKDLLGGGLGGWCFVAHIEDLVCQIGSISSSTC